MSHDLVPRMDYTDFKALAPDVYDLTLALNKAAEQAGLDRQLLELVKLRASQINGCAFCVQYHILVAEKLGIASDRLNMVVVWREALNFSRRERAALAWTEALTRLPDGISDDVYKDISAEFSEKELAYLSAAIAGINVWNRFGASFRWTPPARQQAPRAQAS